MSAKPSRVALDSWLESLQAAPEPPCRPGGGRGPGSGWERLRAGAARARRHGQQQQPYEHLSRRLGA